MFDAELAAVCGPKSKHDRQRAAVRHGTERGLVTLDGHRVSVEHQRARTVDGLEVPLATYRHFAADDLLTEVVMEPMLAGQGTRCHAAAAEPVVSRSPRGHGDEPAGGLAPVRGPDQDRAGVAALLAADLSPLKIAVLMVDGLHVADHCCVVALGITAAGTKVPVELWEGDTENRTVVKHLLAALAERGLEADDGLLVVIGGAKALSRAVRDVFRDRAAIQQLYYPQATERDRASARGRTRRRRPPACPAP
jgi:hypothetical protein